MRKPAALVLVVLALATTIMPVGSTPAPPSATADGPIGIRACQTINQSGSYILLNNLTTTGNCLTINASFVTIDLNGFTIAAPEQGSSGGTGILGGAQLFGIAVRNGMISGGNFTGVDLSQDSGSIVERLQVSVYDTAINANGIVRGNFANSFGGGGWAVIANGLVIDNHAEGGALFGLQASGTVRGNIAGGKGAMGVSSGSTVIGNNAGGGEEELGVSCPSNVVDNIFEAADGLVMFGPGCNNVNNLASSTYTESPHRLPHLPGVMIGPGKGAATTLRTAEGQIEIRRCETINQSGSYILVRNLTATGNCLTINTSYVTIDLNGFLISGAAGVGTGILGVAQTSGFEGIAVRNGSISGFATGVDLSQVYEFCC